MATYKEIQNWVFENYQFTPKTCWIAHVKEIAGMEVHKAPNRLCKDRVFPCPPEKVDLIMRALKYFKMIK